MRNRILPFILLVATLLYPWAQARAEERAHDCLVVVFDGSGSMKERMDGGTAASRIDVARPALKAALAKVPKDTWIGILVFSDAMRDDWIVPLGPRVPDMNDRIDGIRVGGGTPLGEYIEKAEWALLQEREKQPLTSARYRMLVITDGEASDERLMEQVAPDVVERGIELAVIPLGTMNANHKLAAMADRFLPAADAGQLETALAAAVNVESGGNGQAGSDDFAVVASLPDEVAAAWITSVTAPKGNWRFGHKPEPPKPVADAGSAPTPAPAVPSGNQPPAPPECSTSGAVSMSLIGALLALAAVARRRLAT